MRWNLKIASAAALLSAALTAFSSEIDLAGAWRLTGTDESGAPLACPISVPGGVHSALRAAGKLVDPFYGRNELKTQWVGRKTWTISRTFDASRELLSRKAIVLRLDNVDTFAEIRLNGKLLGKTDNRFRRWEFDLKPHLKAGENELSGVFESSEYKGNAIAATYDRDFPICNVPWAKNQALIRKPACHAGWDWGLAQMITGFCGETKILAYDDFKLDYVTSEQEFSENLDHCRLTVSAACTDADGRPFVERKAFEIDDPPLWWPNGAGERKFYTCAFEVRGRKIVRRIGLRKLEVINTRDTDEHGKPGARLAFRVNGREIFMKGANWIPCSAFENEQTPERYRDLLESAVAANMNMIRVWGGGQFEKDCFYDLCDELGILLWHDQMFSCALYPGDERFLASVREELRHQIRRLKDHASIALWCGDNECLGAFYGFKGEKHRYYSEACMRRHAMQEACVKELDPSRMFWPSSPCAGPGDYSDNWHNDASGDMHNWNVWHENKDFDDYYNFKPRFCSEFGYQSFPSRGVAETFCDPVELNPTAPDFEWHQKNVGGNRRILETMARYFRFPQGTDAMLYLSQVQQAIAIKTAVEGWRAQRPRCMGTLFWQLNDNWPVASWSSIEYGGKWKHLQYHARRFFAPLCIVGLPDNRLCAVNDRAQAVSAELTAERWTFDGRLVETKGWKAELPPDGVTPFGLEPAKGEVPTFLALTMRTEDGVFRNFRMDRKFKECDLAKCRIATSFDGFKVTLTSDKPAFFVWVNVKDVRGEFDDNSILLLPDRPVTLIFAPKDKATTPETFRKAFSVTHLRETY